VPEFTNPNQSGGSGGSQDNRSLVLMMIIMVGVFFGLQYYRQKTAPAKPATTQSAPAPNAAATPAAAPLAPATSAPMQAANAPAHSEAHTGTPVSSTPAIQAPAEATTVVENELYKITFSNRGAQVISWILKKQPGANGKPLDLVLQQAAQDFGHPLSLFTYDPAVTAAVNSALYVPSATGALPAPASLPSTTPPMAST
jgi:YidC/Oxa1 family membrane protein insertase